MLSFNQNVLGTSIINKYVNYHSFKSMVIKYLKGLQDLKYCLLMAKIYKETELVKLTIERKTDMQIYENRA